MVWRHWPPTRKSKAWVVVRKPFGPHQRSRLSAWLKASNTSSRRASKTRVTTSSLFASRMSLLLFLQLGEIDVQAFEALLPEAAVALHPLVGLLEARRLQAAGTLLGAAPA